jgi:DNA polymerase sigma
MGSEKRSREILTEQPSKRRKEDNTENLDSLLLQIYEKIQITKQEIQKVKLCQNFISETVYSNRNFHGNIWPYGSFSTDLMLRGYHDVDMGIVTKHFSSSPFRYSGYTSNFTEFRKRGTHVVQFIHVPTNLHCDVIAGAKQDSKKEAEITNKMVMAFCEFPQCRQLIMLIKFWAKRKKLLNDHHNGNTLNSTGLIYLVIHYLQQIGVVPLWRRGGERLSQKRFVPSESKSLFEILKGFFEYYTKFDVEDGIISIVRHEIRSQKEYPRLFSSDRCHLAVENLTGDSNVTRSMIERGWLFITHAMKIAIRHLTNFDLKSTFSEVESKPLPKTVHAARNLPIK